MRKSIFKGVGIGFVVSAVFCLLSTACGLIESSSVLSPGTPAQELTMEKSGSQLWQENCQRCHNFRSPDSLSDAEWDVAVFHMRVRANLTGQEHRAIVEFLKASN